MKNKSSYGSIRRRLLKSSAIVGRHLAVYQCRFSPAQVVWMIDLVWMPF
ncbi:Uncharacterised protein [Serratia quinivorans]|uniref:Uncharacterized protein n=1 Tax=Serratia quinivorans TaxID=137545 RepID=A0A380B420_9GAMM|nr:Uncharacterised protein [Serratia quinivorans]